MCPPELIKHKNKQTRTYTLYNDSVISWKTAETADALRGRGLDFLVLEEAAFWKNGMQLWQDVLSPQLMGRGGVALFISSPNGSNWFRRLEAQAMEDIKAHPTSCEWAVFHGTIYDAGNISAEEIERKKSITPELTWRQEYLAEYVDEVGQVFWEFRRLRNTVDIKPNIDPLFTIRGIDWGISDNTACAFIQPLPNKKAYIFAEHVANNLDLVEQANRIKSIYPMPVRYSVLDSACWARDASLTSVAKRFAANGIGCNQATRDFSGSVSDMKGLIAAGDIIINSKCTNLIEALESWQHDTHEPDILAATRYGIDSLVRSGLLMPPTPAKRNMDMMDLKRQEEEMLRRIERINAHRPGSSMVMRTYDSLR
jgi:hypothetical protein